MEVSQPEVEEQTHMTVEVTKQGSSQSNMEDQSFSVGSGSAE